MTKIQGRLLNTVLQHNSMANRYEDSLQCHCNAEVPTHFEGYSTSISAKNQCKILCLKLVCLRMVPAPHGLESVRSKPHV